MSTLRSLTRSISWNYVEAAASFVMFFLMTPYVVGKLGADGYGVWVLLRAILFYMRFLDFGFHNALVKYVAEHAERKEWPTVNGLIGTTVSVLAVAGVAAFVLSGGVAWLVVPNVFKVPPEQISMLQAATVVLGFDLLLAFPASVLGAIFEGRQRFDFLSLTTILTMLFSAALTVAVLEQGYGVMALVWIEIACTLFSTVLCLWLLWRYFPEIRLRFGRIGGPYLQRIRGYSTWTSFNEILAEGASEVEKLLIPSVLSIAMLTPYTLVTQVASGIFLAVEPITHTFFPLSSAYDAKNDVVRLRELLVRGTKIVMALSLPIAVAVAVYGEQFLAVWIEDVPVVVPHGVMAFIVTSFTVTAFVLTGTTILLALAKVKEVFWMGVTELGLAVVLVLLTASRFGLAGLAASLMIANVLISFLWLSPYLCRQLGLDLAGFLGQSLLRPLAGAVPMALFALWLDPRIPGTSYWGLALKSGLAGSVYALTCYACVLTKEERQLVHRGVRGVMGMGSGGDVEVS